MWNVIYIIQRYTKKKNIQRSFLLTVHINNESRKRWIIKNCGWFKNYWFICHTRNVRSSRGQCILGYSTNNLLYIAHFSKFSTVGNVSHAYRKFAYFAHYTYYIMQKKVWLVCFSKHRLLYCPKRLTAVSPVELWASGLCVYSVLCLRVVWTRVKCLWRPSRGS